MYKYATTINVFSIIINVLRKGTCCNKGVGFTIRAKGNIAKFKITVGMEFY